MSSEQNHNNKDIPAFFDELSLIQHAKYVDTVVIIIDVENSDVLHTEATRNATVNEIRYLRKSATQARLADGRATHKWETCQAAAFLVVRPGGHNTATPAFKSNRGLNAFLLSHHSE